MSFSRVKEPCTIHHVLQVRQKGVVTIVQVYTCQGFCSSRKTLPWQDGVETNHRGFYAGLSKPHLFAHKLLIGSPHTVLTGGLYDLGLIPARM